MNKPPAFQFYVDDFVGGTVELTTEEIGAYILLLCYQWNKGFVPNNDSLIVRIARLTQAFPLGSIKSKFEVSDDGMLRNRRLEEERMKQAIYREKQSENGKKGGRPNNPTITQAFPKPKPTKSSPSPSPSPLDNKKTPSLEEVKLVCVKSGLPESDAVWFWNKCEGNGWKNGGVPIKSYAHTIAAWKAAGYMPSQKSFASKNNFVRQKEPGQIHFYPDSNYDSTQEEA